MSKPKILYVDDEPLNLLLFKVNLSAKYEVYTAADGNEGLDVLSKNNDIGVVLSDMKMPLMNGIEFIKKAAETGPQRSFYIVTGFDITPEIQSAINIGLVQKYFSKPFNMSEIGEEINKGMESC